MVTYTGPRRETRATKAAAAPSARASPVPDPDELYVDVHATLDPFINWTYCLHSVLVYPLTGTGAVNLTNADIKRLDQGQYLNDTLIEFALKYA